MDTSGKFLSEKDASRFLAISARTMQRLRCAGNGPPYVRVSTRRIVYGLADLQQWAKSVSFKSTAEEQYQRRAQAVSPKGGSDD